MSAVSIEAVGGGGDDVVGSGGWWGGRRIENRGIEDPSCWVGWEVGRRACGGGREA